MILSGFSLGQVNASDFPKGASLIAVEAPHLDLYTQPGRGYPIFHVVERGEIIMVTRHRPNWFEVRTEQGLTGWTPATQLATTLQPTGMPVQLPGMNRGEFLKRSSRIGFSTGLMTGLEQQDNQDLTAQTLSIQAGYKLLRAIDLEADAQQIYGRSVYGYAAGANILFEPLTRGRFTPFAAYGSGVMAVRVRPKLVATGDQNYTYQRASLGMNAYIGINFVARIEHQWLFISENNISGMSEWKIGFNTFF